MNVLGNFCLWMSNFAFCLSVLLKIFRPFKANTHFFLKTLFFCSYYFLNK